jgi:hypothetical protein
MGLEEYNHFSAHRQEGFGQFAEATMRTMQLQANWQTGVGQFHKRCLIIAALASGINRTMNGEERC